MSFHNDTLCEKLDIELKSTLEKYVLDQGMREVLTYSLLPAGKFFRPLLVLNLAKDLGDIQPGHKVLSMAVEIHHTYTLIHDDLPAMDNDDYRRGRLSSHKKFNEWTAILAGDSLLGISYEILQELPIEKLPQILKIFGHYTGANGLILGQIKDLGLESKSLQDIITIHELKTAKLIQLCLIGSTVLSDRQDLIPKLESLGYSLGVNFQLLDDLGELTEDLSDHEKDINPFLNHDIQKLINLIKSNNSNLQSILKENQLSSLSKFIESYINKMKSKILNGKSKILEQSSLEETDLDTLWS